MPQWQVRDVLSTDVITAPADASVAEVASLLAGRRISAVPIVDKFDVVVGVVSWTDLRDKLDIGEPDGTVHDGWLRRWTPPRLRWPVAAAIDVMSAPAVTVRPDASVAAAARLMYQKKVGRLLVVDGNGRLVGIVSQRDLLKVHARLDAVIRDEVMQQVLRRTLMIEPGDSAGHRRRRIGDPQRPHRSQIDRAGGGWTHARRSPVSPEWSTG